MAAGEFWYRHRGWLVLPPLLLALFTHDFELEKHVLVWCSGLALFGGGVGLRLWAQQHLHYRLAAETVCTRSGPYALTRNPIYIGNTLICGGLVVLTEVVVLVPVTLLWCGVVYGRVVRFEERTLLERYGEDYRGYLERVPRWWPRPGGGAGRDRPLELVNEHLRASVPAEAHNLLFLLPVLLKELLS